MKFNAIMFDLDGTLLPMELEEFTRGYFGLLIMELAPYGYTKDDIIPAMWQGVAAMVKNDGSVYNSERFWDVFAQILGDGIREHMLTLDKFYTTEFNKAAAFCSPTPLASVAVSLAAEKADKLVLATNPVFPAPAVHSRLKWSGVSPDSFALITDYDNSKFCKPNPSYYREICEKLSLDPSKCLMIGNNTEEDISAAKAAGFSTFLLTDCLISKGDIPDTPKGTFQDLIKYLEKI